MSVQDYEKAKELIKNAGEGDFFGPIPASLILKAETALSVKFPPSYRRFLLEMGCGSIYGLEVFGLIDDNFEKSAVPNGIWLTLDERKSISLNPAYIIVGASGYGPYYALDVRKIDVAGENPVMMLSIDGKPVEQIAESFGSYLLTIISEQQSIIENESHL
ncbi:MAG: SMI1/KNR4 family protein [Verrucomicrobiales bacterium]|jgi:hypothetical protein|nr:SMI1/KNR4 family protein [Verrucomicrobiales bacterium]